MTAEARLTPRELDIMRELVSGGKSDREIAAALGLATGTIKIRMRLLRQKLGPQVRSRVGLALWWERNKQYDARP